MNSSDDLMGMIHTEAMDPSPHRRPTMADSDRAPRISEGDTVTVYWENLPTEFRCEVLYVPCATGDSWVLRREGGEIVVVNSFAKMVRNP